jgi:serine/threonine protein kinase
MAQIRLSLGELPLLKQGTARLAVKLEKNRACSPLSSPGAPFAISPTEIASDRDIPNLFASLYDVKEKIGEGACGVVKKCIRRSTGRPYAVKTMKF